MPNWVEGTSDFIAVESKGLAKAWAQLFQLQRRRKVVKVQRNKGDELCFLCRERVDGNIPVSGEACHDPNFHGVQDLHIERKRILRFQSSELYNCLLLCVCVFRPPCQKLDALCGLL